MFAALRAKSLNPGASVLVLEKSPKPLRKVKISGGGRCNVTHDCDDLDLLLRAYPRGGPRLEAILLRFMPPDTVSWFRERGVVLKVEPDGRMFPTTDSSQTIIDCLLREASSLAVELKTKTGVKSLTGRSGNFELLTDQGLIRCKKVLLATGGASKASQWLETFGHQLVPDIPSLFTFCCQAPLIKDLQGLSVDPVGLTLKTQPEFESEGPLLITHWGLSGPAVLKLSAFAARDMAACSYEVDLHCDLLPSLEKSELVERLEQLDSKKLVRSHCPFPIIPKRLWQRLTEHSRIGKKREWQRLTPQEVERLVQTLKSLNLPITGKGVFKEEFVTSGGVPLHEVDIYTMESRKVPGVFVAGELLNVDGITGGFNFQNAWATGFVAGEGLAG